MCSRKAWKSTGVRGTSPNARMLREDAHQPVGIGVGQRLEEDAAHHAVDRRVAADGERERQGDDGREGRVLRETTYRVDVIAPDLRQPVAGALLRRVESFSGGSPAAGCCSAVVNRDMRHSPCSTTYILQTLLTGVHKDVHSCRLDNCSSSIYDVPTYGHECARRAS